MTGNCVGRELLSGAAKSSAELSNMPLQSRSLRHLFAERRDARCCRNVVVRQLAPAELENTSGVNDTCSTILICFSYCRSFWRSCRRYTEARDEDRLDCAKGLKTLTSKNAQSNHPPLQNRLAWMSGCASLSQLVVRSVKCSPFNGRRAGSMATS